MTHPHLPMLEKMADHVLAQGLTQATLRPLARAAGTSDRMLIYHFGSKDGVIAALLDHITQRFTEILDATSLPAPAALADLIEALAAKMQGPAALPYGCLWLEVVAGAARGGGAYQNAATRILAHFQGWIAARLPPARRSAADTSAAASFALTVIEGCLLLGAAGKDSAPMIAAALSGLRAATGINGTSQQ